MSAVAFLIIALGLSCGIGSNDVRVPPDESLTLNEYSRLGMPELLADWSADQRETARSVLRELADRRPTRLPRFASEKSGLLFEKIVHEEFSRRGLFEGKLGEGTVGELETLGSDALAQLIYRDTLEGIYAPESTEGLLFDRELVEITKQQLANLLQFRNNIEANLTKWESKPRLNTRGKDLTARFREQLQMANRLLVQRLSHLAVFAIAERFTPVARAEATSHLVEQVPRIAPLLSSAARSELQSILREASVTSSAAPELSALSRQW